LPQPGQPSRECVEGAAAPGQVELLEPDIVRFKSLSTRTSGATETNVAQAASG
jgi:hypothetical protein